MNPRRKIDPHLRTNAAAVRSVRDRAYRSQQGHTLRLREALEALQPLLDEGDAEALTLAREIESELAHLIYGSALRDL